MYCSQHLGASSRTLAVTLGVWILRAPSLASLYDRPDIQWRDHRERVSEILFEDSAKKSASKRPPVFKCMHLYQNFLGDLWLWLCRCGRHLLRSRRPVHRALLFFELEKTGGKTHPRNSILLGIQPPESASLLLSRGCWIKIVHGSRYFGVLCTHSSIKGPVNSFQRILSGPLYKLKILAKM